MLGEILNYMYGAGLSIVFYYSFMVVAVNTVFLMTPSSWANWGMVAGAVIVGGVMLFVAWVSLGEIIKLFPL